MRAAEIAAVLVGIRIEAQMMFSHAAVTAEGAACLDLRPPQRSGVEDKPAPSGRFHDGDLIELSDGQTESPSRQAACCPAQTMGFGRKGRIRAGMDADLLVFDPETICDHADFPGLGRPDAAPEGIRFVIVSGEIAAENGRATGVMAGKTLNSFDFIHSSRRAMAGD